MLRNALLIHKHKGCIMDSLSPTFNESIQTLAAKYQQVFEKVNHTLQEAQGKLKLQAIFELNSITTPSLRHQSKEKLKYFESHLTKVKAFADAQVKNYIDELTIVTQQLEPSQQQAFLNEAMRTISQRNEQRYMEYHIQQQWTARMRDLLDFFDERAGQFGVMDNRLSFNEPEALAAYRVRLYQVDSLANLVQQLNKTAQPSSNPTA